LTDTLKRSNRRSLALFAAANAGAATFITSGVPITWEWYAVGRAVAVPSLCALVVSVGLWLLPTSTKETLVFWRRGPSRLPSSRAFSEIARSDPRIDVASLRKRIGDFPRAPGAQTARWYRLYRLHAQEPAVVDAHRAFLLFRDMTALCVLMLALLCVLGLLLSLPLTRALIAASGLLVEYVLLATAGRNAGTRLVGNALAIEASQPPSKAATGGPT
jgi:hypothetical protein